MKESFTRSIRRIHAVIWSRSAEFIRDKSTLGWTLAAPIVFVISLSYAFSGPGTPLFKVAVLVSTGAKLDKASHPFFSTPKILFFEEEIRDEGIRKVQLQRIDMLIDMTFSPGRYWINSQSPASPLVEQALRGSGGPSLERQIARGAGVRYVDWVLPGVLAVNMMSSCLFGVGYVVVRYRKTGHLMRLEATPLRAYEFLIAQVLSRLALILLINTAIFVACLLVFGVRMIGSYWLLFFIALLGGFSMIAISLLVSAQTSSEELAGSILNLVSLPMMFLGGAFFSLDGTPQRMQELASILPLTHIVSGARAIMLEGAGVAQIAPELEFLFIIGMVFLILGAVRFRWRQ
jgi:ABC-2 type transport system permease protein